MVHSSEHCLAIFQSTSSGIDISINNQFICQNLLPNQLTSPTQLSTGIHQLKIHQRENNHFLLLPLLNHSYHTLLIPARAPCFLVSHDIALQPNESLIRFINLMEHVPTIDIAVTGGDVIFSNVSLYTATDFLSLTPMIIDLEVRRSGTKEVLFPLPKVTFEANQAHVVIITPASFKNQQLLPN